MSKCNNIGIYDIDCLIQNQPYSLVATLKTSLGDEIDLSIYESIVFDVFNGRQVIFRKQLGDGIIVQGANNSQIIVLLDQTDTLKINREGLSYELRMVNEMGINNYQIKGVFKNVQLTNSR
jgi:hypothetical protein